MPIKYYSCDHIQWPTPGGHANLQCSCRKCPVQRRSSGAHTGDASWDPWCESPSRSVRWWGSNSEVTTPCTAPVGSGPRSRALKTWRCPRLVPVGTGTLVVCCMFDLEMSSIGTCGHRNISRLLMFDLEMSSTGTCGHRNISRLLMFKL